MPSNYTRNYSNYSSSKLAFLLCMFTVIIWRRNFLCSPHSARAGIMLVEWQNEIKFMGPIVCFRFTLFLAYKRGGRGTLEMRHCLLGSETQRSTLSCYESGVSIKKKIYFSYVYITNHTLISHISFYSYIKQQICGIIQRIFDDSSVL